MEAQFTRIPTIEKDASIVSYFSRKKDENSDELLEKFIDSYLIHPAGWPHTLFFIKKGYQKHEADWQKALEPLGDLDYGVLEVPDRNYCFGYQRMLLERWPERYFLFLSAHTRIRIDLWLERFMRHAASDRLLGFSGSYLSLPEAWNGANAKSFPARWSLAATARRFLFGKEDERKIASRFFHAFPSPALRTNGFMVPPHILETIEWPSCEDILSKMDEYYFESGLFGISSQALKAGMKLFVVGADGEKYPIERWRDSETYHCRTQKNAIFDDNHTRSYAMASRKRKASMELADWGKNAISDPERIVRDANPPDLAHARRCPGCLQRDFLKHFCTIDDHTRNGNDEEFSYSLCLDCGTISIDSVPENLAQYYSGDYPPYETEVNKAITEGYLGVMQEAMPNGGDCLEIGPGAGWLTVAAGNAGFRMSCIEMDRTCCENIRKTCDAVVFHSSDPSELLLSLDRRWDMIVANHLLEHLPDPVGLLSACAEKLEPGGFLVLSAPDIWSLAFRLFREKARSLLDPPRHLTLMTAPQYIRKANECGLSLSRSYRTIVPSRALDRMVWSQIWELYEKERIPLPSSGLRLSYQILVFLSWFYPKNRRFYKPRALKYTLLGLKKLEASLGKSNAFTLVFRKDGERKEEP